PDISPENIRQHLILYHNISVAANYYTPSVCPAGTRITLFRATEQEADTEHSVSLGWDKIIPPVQLTVVDITGSHGSIMKQPNIQFVGKALVDAMKVDAMMSKKED
ncbi:thioesterase domain-containing protein, partial [Xenorhabdus littoralis]|uniref:thioesterase domain-containing protein n=1 Tax=Xenorhabdus littoralis TaxID=2582835 RepID=UPI0029E80849